MKTILSILLLSGLLLTCFSGCAILNFVSGQSPEPPTEPKADEDDLIVNLVAYLDLLDAHWDQLPTSVETKINQIKMGTFTRQPLHIEIDSSSYYYMCGYYNCAHENEAERYSCAKKYTWVKFENANEIQEYNNGEKMIVAFQINEALFVRNILSDSEKTPGFVHFQIYEAKFVDGVNANTPNNLDKTFIYLFNEGLLPEEQVHRNYIYHSTEARGNDWVTFPCTHKADQYYILVKRYAINSDGGRWENDLLSEFGEYYDALINMVYANEEFSVTDETGLTQFYGIVPIYDFVNAVLK